MDKDSTCCICLLGFEHEYQIVRLGCCTANYCRTCSRELKKCGCCRKEVPFDIIPSQLDRDFSGMEIFHDIGVAYAVQDIPFTTESSRGARGSIENPLMVLIQNIGSFNPLMIGMPVEISFNGHYVLNSTVSSFQRHGLSPDVFLISIGNPFPTTEDLTNMTIKSMGSSWVSYSLPI